MVTEFRGAYTPPICQPTTTSATDFAVDQLTCFELGHYTLQRIWIGLFTKRRFSDLLGCPSAVGVDCFEPQHGDQGESCAFAQRFITGRNLDLGLGNVGPGSGQGRRCHAVDDDRLRPPAESPAARGALEVVLVVDGLSKCDSGHQVVTSLALDHFRASQDPLLREQVERRHYLILIGPDRAGEIPSAERRRRGDRRKPVIHLRHDAEQVWMLTCYGF